MLNHWNGLVRGTLQTLLLVQGAFACISVRAEESSCQPVPELVVRTNNHQSIKQSVTISGSGVFDFASVIFTEDELKKVEKDMTCAELLQEISNRKALGQLQGVSFVFNAKNASVALRQHASSLTALTDMELFGVDNTVLDNIVALTTLRTLKFRFCQISDSAIGRPSELQNLESLEMTDGTVSTSVELANAISGLPHLKHLSILPPRSQDLEAICKKLASPRLLEFPFNLIADSKFDFLPDFPNIRELTIILQENSNTNAMDTIAKLTQLEELTIYAGHNGSFKLGNFNSLKRLRKLALTLQESLIASIGFQRLPDIPTEVALDATPLPSRKVSLHPLLQIPKLTRLRLNYQNIDDTKLSTLNGVTAETIYLEGNPITEHGLTKLISSSKIEKFFIRNTAVNVSESFLALARNRGVKLDYDQPTPDIVDIPLSLNKKAADQHSIELSYTKLSSNDFNNRACFYLSREEYEKAIPELDALLSRNRLSAVALKNRGYALHEAGKARSSGKGSQSRIRTKP